jgi:ABC-type sugar transport system ATPase subunit
MKDNKVLLNIEGVSKNYGGLQALKKVDFTVRQGEIIGLVGDNGAGKSTLIKIISGLIRPDSGNIYFQL